MCVSCVPIATRWDGKPLPILFCLVGGRVCRWRCATLAVGAEHGTSQYLSRCLYLCLCLCKATEVGWRRVLQVGHMRRKVPASWPFTYHLTSARERERKSHQDASRENRRHACTQHRDVGASTGWELSTALAQPTASPRQPGGYDAPWDVVSVLFWAFWSLSFFSLHKLVITCRCTLFVPPGKVFSVPCSGWSGVVVRTAWQGKEQCPLCFPFVQSFAFRRATPLASGCRTAQRFSLPCSAAAAAAAGGRCTQTQNERHAPGHGQAISELPTGRAGWRLSVRSASAGPGALSALVLVLLGVGTIRSARGMRAQLCLRALYVCWLLSATATAVQVAGWHPPAHSHTPPLLSPNSHTSPSLPPPTAHHLSSPSPAVPGPGPLARWLSLTDWLLESNSDAGAPTVTRRLAWPGLGT